MCKEGKWAPMKMRYWHVVAVMILAVLFNGYAFAQPANLFIVVAIEGTKHGDHLSVVLDGAALRDLDSMVCNGEIVGKSKKYPISVIFYGGKSSGRGFVVSMWGFKDNEWSSLRGDLPIPLLPNDVASIDMVSHSPTGYMLSITTFFSKMPRDDLFNYWKAAYKSKDLVCEPNS